MEIEIRSPVENPDAIQQRLRQSGFEEEPEYEQMDIVLDKPDASLFRSGRKIRIRIEKERAELTYKGFMEGDASASRRREINVPVPVRSVDGLIQFFESLGYPVCFRIPKRRRTYRKEGITVVLDNWPVIGWLMEIEGNEERVKALASALVPGVSFANYRLRDLFRMAESRTGMTFVDLKKDHEARYRVDLGKLELLLD